MCCRFSQFAMDRSNVSFAADAGLDRTSRSLPLAEAGDLTSALIRHGSGAPLPVRPGRRRR